MNVEDQAIEILGVCARALMRSGGMLNADLAREAVRIAKRMEQAKREAEFRARQALAKAAA